MARSFGWRDLVQRGDNQKVVMVSITIGAGELQRCWQEGVAGEMGLETRKHRASSNLNDEVNE